MHAATRGVQIRSESDPNPIRSDRIRSDFGTKTLISDRIELEKLFRSRIESDFVIGRRSLFPLVILLCMYMIVNVQSDPMHTSSSNPSPYL